MTSSQLLACQTSAAPSPVQEDGRLVQLAAAWQAFSPRARRAWQSRRDLHLLAAPDDNLLRPSKASQSPEENPLPVTIIYPDFI